MTNRIDQFTQYLTDNPLSSRVSNRERTTVNPLARQLTTAQTLSLDTTVAAVTPPDTVPPVTLVPDQGSAVITADPQDLERIKQEIISENITPILAQLPLLATEEFVNTAISNIDITGIDLGGLATETYVDTAISNIDITGINLGGLATETFVNTAVGAAVTGLINAAPAALDTLKELSTALADDPVFATTIATALGTKAPVNNPTFTGTVSGISAAMVGLGNVTNESKATMFTNPTFTGTASLTLPALTVDPETLVINNTAATGLYNGNITGQLRLASRVTNGLGSSSINITPNVLANNTLGQPINNLLPVTFGVIGETYIVDAEFILTTTGTISHTERVGIAPPPNSFFEAVITRETITGTTASTTNIHRITAPGTTVITGAITTAQTARYTVRVIYTAADTDTFQINVSFSAAPGGVSTIVRSIQSARVISSPGQSLGQFFGAV